MNDQSESRIFKFGLIKKHRYDDGSWLLKVPILYVLSRVIIYKASGEPFLSHTVFLLYSVKYGLSIITSKILSNENKKKMVVPEK